jgi:hypothetical protein
MGTGWLDRHKIEKKIAYEDIFDWSRGEYFQKFCRDGEK